MVRLLSIFLFGLLTFPAKSQVTITIDDLADEDDIIVRSTANPLSDFELSETGDDMVWDYSWLEPIAQDSSVWVDPTSTNIAYFFLWFSSNVAEETGQDFDAEFFSFEDIYNFYDRNEGSLAITGVAGTVTGIPLPALFDGEDVVYDLPLEFEDSYSSSSSFSLEIPTIGSWSESRNRSCEVDGWGTITTPYGTFDALRVFCESDIEDVIEFSGFEIPFSYVLREYKWLAPEQKIPVLQITSQEILGFETVTAVTYIDSLESTTSLSETFNSGFSFSVTPTLVTQNEAQIGWETPEPGMFQYTVLHVNGMPVSETTSVEVPAGYYASSISLQGLPAGFYLVSATWNGRLLPHQKLVVVK